MREDVGGDAPPQTMSAAEGANELAGGPFKCSFGLSGKHPATESSRSAFAHSCCPFGLNLHATYPYTQRSKLCSSRLIFGLSAGGLGGVGSTRELAPSSSTEVERFPGRWHG